MATKQELEEAIGAMYEDISRTIMKYESRAANDEWTAGFVHAAKEARELIGIVVKTYRIPHTINETTNKG